jgi:hypothetical protein
MTYRIGPPLAREFQVLHHRVRAEAYDMHDGPLVALNADSLAGAAEHDDE